MLETVTTPSKDLSTILSSKTHFKTPAYAIDEAALVKNLEIFKEIQVHCGCKIILALKAFSNFKLFPIINRYLAGSTASSLNEARLAKEEFGKDVHTYAAAFLDHEMADMINYSDVITFNSQQQWQKFKKQVKNSKKNISCGLRLNPEHSEVEIPMYDPCGRYSRFGVTRSELCLDALDGLDGFLIHSLCGKDVDSLERVIHAIESKFSDILHRVSWVNLGGGHMISRPGYNVKKLCELITGFQNKYGVQVILEPGEGIVLNTGFLITEVVDLFRNEKEIAILNTSASTHMPDVLEMPYRPRLLNSGEPGKYPYTYRLGGITCLSGDVIGEYSFKTPLELGQRLVFCDMAQYTMVKNTTFNGVNLPSIYTINQQHEVTCVKHFGFSDFKNRLS